MWRACSYTGATVPTLRNTCAFQSVVVFGKLPGGVAFAGTTEGSHETVVEECRSVAVCTRATFAPDSVYQRFRGEALRGRYYQPRTFRLEQCCRAYELGSPKDLRNGLRASTVLSTRRHSRDDGGRPSWGDSHTSFSTGRRFRCTVSVGLSSGELASLPRQ